MMSMYSLYRAWLLRDTASIASPSLSLPPDLLIAASTPPHPPYQFIAHRSLVSSHSAYLKSAIAQGEQLALSEHLPQPGAPHMASSFGMGALPSTTFSAAQGVLEVSLPSSIQADSFSPLLTFMYTGYLDLNLHNIYELLLAVNILQMPHALDLCRSYLLHNVHSVASLTFNTTPLAKPIPDRRGLPSLLAETPLPADQQPLPMDTTEPAHVKQQEASVQSHSTSPPPLASSIPPPAPVTSTKRSSQVRRRRRFTKLSKPPVPAVCTPTAPDSDSSDDVTVVTMERARPSCTLAVSSGNTVVDVASCDGPVHFTRVLNENYNLYRGGRPGPGELSKEEESEGEINIEENSSEEGEGEENEENIARHLETAASFQINFRHQIERQSRGAPARDTSAERLKVLGGGGGGGVTPGRATQRRVIPQTVLKPVAASQREVRLLDMNVQYYPCKTCRAKFPSYYFVHKHRRREHPEEEQGGGGGGALPPNQSNEVDTSTGKQ